MSEGKDSNANIKSELVPIFENDDIEKDYSEKGYRLKVKGESMLKILCYNHIKICKQIKYHSIMIYP